MVRLPTTPLRSVPLVRRVATFVLLMSGSAQAHIDLVSPAPRYAPGVSANANKSCPCGVGTTSRVCNKPAERSDPNRSEDVTPLTAGEMVTLKFNETVNHSGRFRIAIDYDGADLDDFNENILLDVPDDATHNVGTGNQWELTFQVPAMECTNCTLQLIQVMEVSTEDEVPDPTTLSTYYQCADITISTEGTTLPSPSASAGGGPVPSSTMSAVPSSSTSEPVPSLTATMGAAPMLTIQPPPPPASAASTTGSALPDPMTTSSTAVSTTPPAAPSAVAPAASSTPLPEVSAPVPMASVSPPPEDESAPDGAECSVTSPGKPTEFSAIGAALAAFGLIALARRSRGRTRSANQ
jgi:Lytic polysaccharide mono-oxygenase, cellulose-degrading